MRPNIIFYFTDQQRWDTINEKVTPNLIQLSKEGVIFENSFTCQPVCGPARACLQTGVYATQNKCYFNGIPLPDDKQLLAEYLGEAGYETGYVGKWHLASNRNPFIGSHCEKTAIPKELQGGYKNWWRASDVLEFTSHGYDGYVFDENGNKIEFEGYRADCINDFALEYIDQKTSDDPFFLFISQIEPHHQNDRHCYEGKKEYLEEFENYPIPKDLSFLKGDYNEMYQDYLAAIKSVDDNVGRLVEKLKEKNLYDNTVIIFTSDHGSHFKTRNSEYKRSCHDSSIHTPLIISGGKFKSGEADERLVSLIDLPATILDLAEISIPDYFTGKSLVHQVEDKTLERDCVFIQISESQCGRAIRTKRYKYSIRAVSGGLGYFLGKSKLYFEDYLYDLDKDKIERNNLIRSEEYSKVKSQLKKMLRREMANCGEKNPIIFPALKVRKI